MTINRDDYRWIHERLFIETLSNIESNEYIDYNLLESQLMNVLQEGGIAPKDINNVNVKVINYCETIVGFPKYPKDEFFSLVENLLEKVLSSDLSNEEKEEIIVFAEVQYVCTELINYISFVSNNGNSKEQLPRTSYSSSDGELRIERQLNACMHYQYDGHTETFVGKLLYFVGLPITAIEDILICSEEIIRGYWDHVKVNSIHTTNQQQILIKNSIENGGTRNF